MELKAQIVEAEKRLLSEQGASGRKVRRGQRKERKQNIAKMETQVR